ncbi:MAG: hypothetical protein VKK98_07290 [Cyanobacteriota bacterium]|nr:hypothetical protein [Cyanobacteriota bacterium]
MAALTLLVLISLAAFHWLMAPLLSVLLGPLELHGLPWLGLVLLGWMLSGDHHRRADGRSEP